MSARLSLAHLHHDEKHGAQVGQGSSLTVSNNPLCKVASDCCAKGSLPSPEVVRSNGFGEKVASLRWTNILHYPSHCRNRCKIRLVSRCDRHWHWVRPSRHEVDRGNSQEMGDGDDQAKNTDKPKLKVRTEEPRRLLDVAYGASVPVLQIRETSAITGSRKIGRHLPQLHYCAARLAE